MPYDIKIADKIKECIRIMGGYDSAVVKTGIPKRTLANYATGESEPKTSAAVAIAEGANKTVGWLLTIDGQIDAGSNYTVRDQRGSEYMPAVIKGPKLFPVPIINTAASAGAGAVVPETEQAVGHVGFDPAWLSKNNMMPTDLFAIPSMGTSMEPTILPGEYLVCSKAEHHTKLTDGVFVVRVDGNVLVKRLQPLPNSRVKISSDNALYDPYTVELNDGTDFKILGSVIFTLRRL